MPAAVRALRGATTVDVDEESHVHERTVSLVAAMCERNGVEHDDDIHSTFPALGVRRIGFGDVPLICARELDIVTGTPRCIRVLMHLTTERSRDELHHVYLEGAVNLRDDLPA